MTPAARRERLLHLLHRGSTTISAVAGTLQVTERTVYRDIAMLREAGHRILAAPGPGGGVRIAPDSRPRPVHFEVAEIIGLALSVALLKATPHMPFARSAEAALDRARRALSAERQRAMRRLERRILIGAPASERVRQSVGTVDDDLLSVFERCFTEGRQLRFRYADKNNNQTDRRAECIALLLHAPCWYIVTWDLDKDAPRTFRMDRIRDPARGDALAGSHPLAAVTDQICPEAEAPYLKWIGVPIV